MSRKISAPIKDRHIFIVAACILLAPVFVSKLHLIPLWPEDKIGDTIGGITSPLVGLFSAWLVYRAFLVQFEANKELAAQRQEDNFRHAMELLFSSMEKKAYSFRVNPNAAIGLYGMDTATIEDGLESLSYYADRIEFLIKQILAKHPGRQTISLLELPKEMYDINLNKHIAIVEDMKMIAEYLKNANDVHPSLIKLYIYNLQHHECVGEYNPLGRLTDILGIIESPPYVKGEYTQVFGPTYLFGEYDKVRAILIRLNLELAKNTAKDLHTRRSP